MHANKKILLKKFKHIIYNDRDIIIKYFNSLSNNNNNNKHKSLNSINFFA